MGLSAFVALLVTQSPNIGVEDWETHEVRDRIETIGSSYDMDDD